MLRLYVIIFAFLPFLPPFLAMFGAVISLRLSRHRWIVHTTTLAAMIFALPIYFYILGWIDPVLVESTSPGAGFGVLMYLIMLLPAALIYLIFSIFNWRGPAQT